MKAAWDQLGDSFTDSPTVIIGDVDCTVHKQVCSKYGVQGYPTIKYFTSSSDATGSKYEGGRDFAALKAFADTSLGPSCSADNIDLCSADDRAVIEEAQALGEPALSEKIAALDKSIADHESFFKTEVEKLQNAYQKLSENKDAAIAAESPTLRLYRAAVKKDKKKDEL